jgi:ribonuclease P protein component
MARKLGFPRQSRLLRERDFKRVYESGERLSCYPLRFRVLRRADGGSRLGLSVGQKVGDAVRRNRWKRAIREAFRLNRHLLRSPYEVVASVDWQAGPEDVGRVQAAVLKLFTALNQAEEEGRQP